MQRVQLVFRSRRETLTASIPKALFDAVRLRAKKTGVPYQRFIRHVLERAVTAPKRSKAKAG